MTVTRYFSVDSVVQPVQPAAGPVRNATATPAAAATPVNRIAVTGYDCDNDNAVIGYDRGGSFRGGRDPRQLAVTTVAAVSSESQSASSSSPEHVLADTPSVDHHRPVLGPVSETRGR